jgi:ATP-dependent Lhr-like helicase
VRTTPITLLIRRHAPFWHELSANDEALQPTGRAQAVAAFIRTHGASFFDEILIGTGLLRSQAEEAVAELVALGLVASDSFGGLRTLLLPSDRRGPADAGRRRRRSAVSSMDDAGRWALTRRGQIGQGGVEPNGIGPARPKFSADSVEHAARTLLSRYGVVFWRVIEREADWLPPWRDLLLVYRRLEARGEIRGGRFVAGFSGEQFALPDAIGLLRETRRTPGSRQFVSLSGADPLNLVGILTPGPKLPALTLSRLLYRDGLPIAALTGGEVRFYEELPQAEQWQVRKALLRGTTPPIMADPASA